MLNSNSRMTELLKSYQGQCPSSVYKLYLISDLSEKKIKNIFKGLKLPIVYDDILAFFDTSVLLNCKSGILYMENGCYISRILSCTYYVEYSEIQSIKVADDALKISLQTGDEVQTVSFSGGNLIPEYLRQLFIYIISIRKEQICWKTTNAAKKSGPVKDIKELISKKEYSTCNKIIHTASMACAVVGAVPLINCADTFIITPVQVAMLLALGNVFNVNLTESMARSFIFSCGGAIAGRSISRYTIGLIPGVGSVVNLLTGASLTEAIGWKFVNDYAVNKNVCIKASLSQAIQAFQDRIDALSEKEYQRFAKDMEFISNQKLGQDKSKVNDIFFDIMARYSFAYRIEITDIVNDYVNCLRAILKSSEIIIDMSSRAGRYYGKFKSMEFNCEDIDFERLTDFTELFLVFYHSAQGKNQSDKIQSFSFDIEDENPAVFFSKLYGGQKQNDKKQLQKKYMIHALTSLIYGYAVDRETETVQ